MLDPVYEFLGAIGYTHPLHPMMVHIPSGLTIAAFLLGLTALLFRRPALARSARHCIILVLIFLFPTVSCGIMDWQYYFSGAWLEPITIKIIVSCAFLVLLMLAIFLGRGGRFASNAVLAVYTLCFLSVVVIGYFGGELAFGNKAPQASPEYLAGEKIFFKDCNSCHPFGGNVVNPKLTVLGAPELINFRIFLGYLRDPKQPKPAIAIMPIVPLEKVSDEQAKQLFDYITKVLERPRRPLDPSLYPMPPA
jgi:uncharacterized membrane protein